MNIRKDQCGIIILNFMIRLKRAQWNKNNAPGAARAQTKYNTKFEPWKQLSWQVQTFVAIPNDTDFNNYSTNRIPSKLSDYEQYRITESTPIKVPIDIITFNNESISTEGNLTTVSGASKSGKTASMSFVIAGAISVNGNVIDKLEGLEVAPNTYHKAVIHIDTEQARHKHQYNLKSILKRADLVKCPDYFLLIIYAN